MSLSPKGSPTVPSSQDSIPVTYLAARERFLSRIPEKEDGLIPYYADVGRYVVDRWQAEERDRKEGQALDEAVTDCRWDECTEKHLRDLSTEVGVAYQLHIRQERVRSLAVQFGSQLKPISLAARFLGWFLRESSGAIAGLVGILLFGVALVYFFPGVTQSARGNLEDLFREAPSGQPGIQAPKSPDQRDGRSGE